MLKELGQAIKHNPLTVVYSTALVLLVAAVLAYLGDVYLLVLNS